MEGDRQRTQNLVPREVSQRVVEALEVVYIEEDQANADASVFGAGDLISNPLVEGAVVAEPGQRVAGRLCAGIGQLVVALLQLLVRPAKLLGMCLHRRHHVVQHRSKVGQLTGAGGRRPRR